MSSARVASDSSASRAVRGVRASSAVFSPKRIDRLSRSAARGSRLPSAADDRNNNSSSGSDRTADSSSCGSTPSLRTAQFAARSESEITGPNTTA